MFHFRGELTHDDFFDFQLEAGVVDVDSDEVAFDIVIQNHPIGHLAAIDAGAWKTGRCKGSQFLDSSLLSRP